MWATLLIVGSELGAFASPVTPPIPSDSSTVAEAMGAFTPALEQLGENDPAFASVEIDTETRRFTVWRSDDVTTVGQSRYASLSPVKYPLDFKRSPLSAIQSKRIWAIMKRNASKWREAGLSLQRASQDEPSQPMTIMYTTAEGRETHAALATLQTAFANFPNNSVRFEYGAEVAASRGSDTSPFFGGAAIYFPFANGTTIANTCSDGFSAKNSAGYYVLTAWHCFKPIDPRAWATNNYKAVSGTLIGTINTSDGPLDAAYIRLATPSVAAAVIHSGGPGDEAQIKRVVGTHDPKSGELACTSGVVMKAVCNLKFGSPTLYYVQNIYTGVYSEVTGISLYSKVAATAILSNGDSGGPVFSLTNGNTQVIALGLISASPESFIGTAQAMSRPGISVIRE
jgi:hypothetical protein